MGFGEAFRRHRQTCDAYNVFDGTLIGRNVRRRRHQEFIRFLNALEEQVPAGKKNARWRTALEIKYTLEITQQC